MTVRLYEPNLHRIRGLRRLQRYSGKIKKIPALLSGFISGGAGASLELRLISVRETVCASLISRRVSAREMKRVLLTARRAEEQRPRIQARAHRRDSLREPAAEAQRKRAGVRVAQQWISLKAPRVEAQESQAETW